MRSREFDSVETNAAGFAGGWRLPFTLVCLALNVKRLHGLKAA